MPANDGATELGRRRFIQLSGIVGGGALLIGAGRNLTAGHPPGGPPQSGGPNCPPPASDHLWQAVEHCNGGGAGCAALQKGRDDYVFAGMPHQAPNWITVPNLPIIGIECPWIADPGRPNYWQSARDWAETSPTKVNAPVGLGINSKSARDADQLHIHMATVRSYSLNDLTRQDSATSPGFANWHTTRVAITGWNAQAGATRTHGYRVAHVSSINNVNLFEELKSMIAKDMSIPQSMREMQYQTLIVIPRPGGGFYIVNSQAALKGPRSETGSDTCDPLLKLQPGGGG